MYEGFNKEIYSTFFQFNNEVVDSVPEEDLTLKQSQRVPEVVRSQLQASWQQAVASALAPVASFDPSIRDRTRKGWVEERNFYNSQTQEWESVQEIHPEINLPPEELSAAEASSWPKGKMGVDIRPHLWDNKSKLNWLCDSGSQITALPPEPGDQPAPNMFLKAVNGTKLQCYGFKDVKIQVGRKQYKFKAIKADV